MKRLALSVLSIAILSFLFLQSVAAQETHPGCTFNIAGTWQSSTSGRVNPTRASFAKNGVMTELSLSSEKKAAWEVVSKSHYLLDLPTAPKAMVLTKIEKRQGLSTGTTLEITTFDDGLFISKVAGDPSGELTRWTRVDPYRYFVVLAAAKGDPGFGGPGFAMLIKTDGVHTQTDTFGTWPVVNKYERHAMIGIMPEEFIKPFDNEPLNDTGAMFRLEVTAGPYNRALDVLKTWVRRKNENQLLYPTIPYLNNAVFLNQLVSSLNETDVMTWNRGTPCTETIKLQRLTWLLSDEIMAKHNLPQTPYYLFKKLRELNGSLHLNDSQFHAALAGNQPARVAISSR